jgi:hypothetical protein
MIKAGSRNGFFKIFIVINTPKIPNMIMALLQAPVSEEYCSKLILARFVMTRYTIDPVNIKRRVVIACTLYLRLTYMPDAIAIVKTTTNKSSF